MRWPLILRRDYDALRTENYVLREALRDANAELHRHRMLIGGLRSGQSETLDKLDRVLKQGQTP